MRLYVRDGNQKRYLNNVASTRGELARQIGSAWFNAHGRTYHVNHVIAESSQNGTGTGAVVGGLIGLLGGPLGAIIGGVLGGAIGNDNDNGENSKVEYFNNSAV